MKTIRIGSGAGYSGDRIDPAVELAAKGDIAYLGFECLAERTIALAQQERLARPEAGLRPPAGRALRGGAADLRRQAHPHHHQHGRRQPAGGGRARGGDRRPPGHHTACASPR